MIDGDHVSIAYVTTTPFTGDYPLLTVALRIRPDVPAGTRTLFTLNPSSLWTLNGRPVGTRVSPATVTAGGSVAVSSVSPGEGWFPAGTVVSVRGVGFNGQTRVHLENANITAERVVSATEIRFTLAEAAMMTAARVRVDNPDGSRVIYYAIASVRRHEQPGAAPATTDFPAPHGRSRPSAPFLPRTRCSISRSRFRILASPAPTSP